MNNTNSAWILQSQSVLTYSAKKIITKTKIGKDDDGLYCTDGLIRIKINESDLNSFYIDTPDNRKILKANINTLTPSID